MGPCRLSPSSVTLAGMADQGRARNQVVSADDDDKNPVWFKPVMFGLMLVGLVWILVYYIAGTGWPIPAIGPWNIAVGFGVMFAGFLMTTRWR